MDPTWAVFIGFGLFFKNNLWKYWKKYFTKKVINFSWILKTYLNALGDFFSQYLAAMIYEYWKQKNTYLILLVLQLLEHPYRICHCRWRGRQPDLASSAVLYYGLWHPPALSYPCNHGNKICKIIKVLKTTVLVGDRI